MWIVLDTLTPGFTTHDRYMDAQADYEKRVYDQQTSGVYGPQNVYMANVVESSQPEWVAV